MAQKYNLIQSVCRAFTILEQFSHNERELGVTAIAARVGLHKSTCFGLLNTLQELGYIKQNAETGRYSLGLKTFELGQAYIEGQDLRLLAAPFLRTLVEKTQETVHLVALEGERAVYIDKVEGAHAITISSHIGQQAKLHCTGVGKVLLANMPLQEQDNILSRELDQVTDKTITAQTKLREHLREIKYHGYGIDDEEIEIGLRCVRRSHIQCARQGFRRREYFRTKHAHHSGQICRIRQPGLRNRQGNIPPVGQQLVPQLSHKRVTGKIPFYAAARCGAAVLLPI